MLYNAALTTEAATIPTQQKQKVFAAIQRRGGFANMILSYSLLVFLCCMVQAWSRPSALHQSAAPSTLKLRSKSKRSEGIFHSTTCQPFIFPANGVSVAAQRGPEDNDKGSSIATSIFNLTKIIIAAGILALPSGLATISDSRVALVPSCATLIFMGLLSSYSFSSIGRACAITDSTTFTEAWYKLVSPITAKVIATMITYKTLDTCLVFSMVLGETFTKIAASFGLSKLLLFQSRTNTILTITVLGILPLCCQKNLDALKYSSRLGMAGIFYCAAFMVYRYLDGSYVEGGKFFPLIAESMQPSFDVAGPKPFVRVFGLLSMMSTAFIAHYSAPRLFNELKSRSVERFSTVTRYGFAITILLYLTVLLVGFLTFGGNSTGFILNNYASSDQLATMARLAIGLGVLCTYPLTFTAFRDGLFDLIGIESIEQRDRITLPVTAAVLTAITSLAVRLKNVGAVIRFSGALVASSLTYLIPAIMNIAAIRKEAVGVVTDKNNGFFSFSGLSSEQRLQMIGNIMMGILSMLIAVLGVAVSLNLIG